MSIQQRRSSLAFGCSLLQDLIDLVFAVYDDFLQTMYDAGALRPTTANGNELYCFRRLIPNFTLFIHMLI